jgi:hypothetical protein
MLAANTYRKVDAYNELMNRNINEAFKRYGQD